MGQRNNPVSYTHLDVYKRQGVGLAAPQIGLPIRVVVVDLDVLSEDYPEYKGFRKAYINAVSYTHLDVYKRQL